MTALCDNIKNVKSSSLSCPLFTANKFLATFEHDKMKSRMAANGNEQDPIEYQDRWSLTVTAHSIFTRLAVAESNRRYKLTKIYVKGALYSPRCKVLMFISDGICTVLS